MWIKRFKDGCEEVTDLPRTGRPSVREKKVQQVAASIGEDRHKTIPQISREVELSQTSVQRILTKDLKLTKIAAKFVPHMLNDRQRAHRARICRQNLESVRTEKYFLEKIITGDECWVSLYENQTKIESCEWVYRGDPHIRPIKALRSPSPRKVMLILFCDFSGPLLIHFVPKKETVDSDCYISVLKLLKDRIRHKRPGMWAGGADGQTDRDFYLHHDNASPHVSAPTLGFIGNSNIRLLPHPQYSPDLAPCDFFIFPYMKKQLRGRRFPNLESLKAEVTQILKSMNSNLFEMAIRNLAVRWKKCEAVEGHYFEGWKLEIDDISEAEVTTEESASEPETDVESQSTDE